MHNDTPLGTIMHLKELDRQAAAKSSALQLKKPAGPIFGASAVALLRRVRAVITGTGSSRRFRLARAEAIHASDGARNIVTVPNWAINQTTDR